MKLRFLIISLIASSLQDEVTDHDPQHKHDFADLHGWCEEGVLASIGKHYNTAELITCGG